MIYSLGDKVWSIYKEKPLVICGYEETPIVDMFVLPAVIVGYEVIDGIRDSRYCYFLNSGVKRMQDEVFETRQDAIRYIVELVKKEINNE